MPKHLDELVKRQLKKQAKLKEKKRKLGTPNSFSTTPVSNEHVSDDNEEEVVDDIVIEDAEDKPRKSKFQYD